MGTSLRIGCDAARVVVSSAGDKAWAELAEALPNAKFTEDLDGCVAPNGNRLPLIFSTNHAPKRSGLGYQIVQIIMNAAKVMAVIASKKTPSTIFINASDMEDLCERSAQKIR